MRSTLFAMLLCSGTALASDASSRLPDVPSHTSEADFESTDIGCREEPFDYWGASASQQIRVIHQPKPTLRRLGFWRVRDAQGRRLNALDVAKELGLQLETDALRDRRRREGRRALSGVAMGAGGLSLIVIGLLGAGGPVVVLGCGLGIAGGLFFVAAPIIWHVQRRQFDRWFDRDGLLLEIEAYNTGCRDPSKAGL